jgi:hypothetical protein
MIVMTREELIAKVREVFRRQGGPTLSSRQFHTQAHISNSTVERLFGSWTTLCEAAGIAAHRRRVAATDEDVFREMYRTFLALSCVPPRSEFIREFDYSHQVLTRRGWDYTTAKAKFAEWAAVERPDFPYMDQLAGGPPPSSGTGRARPRRNGAAPDRVHLPIGVRFVGEPINFGAMVNAPVNEMGVVALFAMVAERLGYAIELMDRTFPDCEARRRIHGDRWERVQIEFEYRASNFECHRHDRARCDVLACWIADRRPEGLEIIELRSVIETLRRQPPPATSPTETPGNDVAKIGDDVAQSGNDVAQGGDDVVKGGDDVAESGN